MQNSNENGNGDHEKNERSEMYRGYGSDRRVGLNIHSKEFIRTSNYGHQQSKSSGNVLHGNHQKQKRHHSKLGHNLKAGTIFYLRKDNYSSPMVHFTEDTRPNEPDKKSRYNNTSSAEYGVGHPVKRSKSSGSPDFRTYFINERSPLDEIGPWAQDIETLITKALNDPNTLSELQLMEVVEHVTTRVIESSSHAEPTARLCINIIEKENGETFLETLLNTCQEYFQEKDGLLRTEHPGQYSGYVPDHPKWIAFMRFLNEMYTQLKMCRNQLMKQRMQNSGYLPGLVLLSLLAQCCGISLQEQNVNSRSEIDCLFFVLTGVGRDIQSEMPQQMSTVMDAAREAFIEFAHVSEVKKTLLQLIEMHAARWQLPASAITYYLKGSSAKI